MSSAAGNGSSDKVASKLHVVHCFDSVVEQLLGQANHAPLKHKWNGDKYPLFVTWKKRHSNGVDWKLRGCIGTFAPKELGAGLREYALIAAFQDTRFSPISTAEISALRCDISLLTDFEDRSGGLHDWTVGVHGVTLEFLDPQSARRHSATFLPEVAAEQGWSHADTINELVHKSGFRGSVTSQLQAKMKLTRYQSQKESLLYADYLTLRKSLGGDISKQAAPEEVPFADVDDEDE